MTRRTKELLAEEDKQATEKLRRAFSAEWFELGDARQILLIPVRNDLTALLRRCVKWNLLEMRVEGPEPEYRCR